MRLRARCPPLLPEADLIRSLARLLDETGLCEIEYAVGDRRIRVARNRTAVAGEGLRESPGAVPLQASAPFPPANAEAPEAADPARHPGALTAPMVGTAYLAPEPGARPFVHVGEEVKEGETVLIIEAMKVMNQIRAPRSGRVRRVFVADGAPVEYGAPLMVIE